MERVTVKLDPRIADRVRRAKIQMSAELGHQLTTSQAVEYLLEHWAITREQRHVMTLTPAGQIVGLHNAKA